MDPKEFKTKDIDFEVEGNKDKLSRYKPVRVDTIGDGSCYFHAILHGIYQDYRNPGFDRRGFVKGIRLELAKKLEESYSSLSRGMLKEMSKEVEALSLNSLKSTLASSAPVGNEFQELVSDTFDIDIYMLELSRKDVLIMSGDDGILYKKRNSVVLISTGNHYELVCATNDKGTLDSLFSHDHPFIKVINGRIAALQKK